MTPCLGLAGSGRRSRRRDQVRASCESMKVTLKGWVAIMIAASESWAPAYHSDAYRRQWESRHRSSGRPVEVSEARAWRERRNRDRWRRRSCAADVAAVAAKKGVATKGAGSAVTPLVLGTSPRSITGRRNTENTGEPPRLEVAASVFCGPVAAVIGPSDVALAAQEVVVPEGSGPVGPEVELPHPPEPRASGADARALVVSSAKTGPTPTGPSVLRPTESGSGQLARSMTQP
ncbi:hypothetical protein ZWY2020_054745 [Hordeum vulgare]|nr:hypothetical protein ZWY2020_054745 [Hordeum vulgare]